MIPPCRLPSLGAAAAAGTLLLMVSAAAAAAAPPAGFTPAGNMDRKKIPARFKWKLSPNQKPMQRWPSCWTRPWPAWRSC